MIPLVLVACLVVGAVSILMTRYGHQGERGAPSDIVAHAGAMVLFAVIGVAAVWYGFTPLARWVGPTPASIGALAGLYLLIVVAGGRRLAGMLFLWSTRRPVELDRAGFEIRSAVVSAIGYVTVGAGVGWASSALPQGMRLLLLPAFVTALPFFQSVVRPWLILFRAPTLSDVDRRSGVSDLEAWFVEITKASGLSGVRLRVQPGNMQNAYVVGGFWGHWVVVGEGLLQKLADRELRAILAHELAHVIRKDVRRYLLAAAVAGTVYMLGLPNVFRLWRDGHVLPGVVVAGLLGGICFGAIPGWISRRAEFAADRLAVELAGDAEGLASGLRTLAKIKGFPTERESLTHPSVDSRIKALEPAQA